MSDPNLESAFQRSALDYHEAEPPGKIAIQATKPLANQRDLALAYSPGVAHACMAIAEDPAAVARLTARGNLVGVVTNGTAVLGLGNIGPLAAKPVMEGKAVLFKKFAGIDGYDIEVAESEIDAFVEAVARLEPTFGGINLEDIKSPVSEPRRTPRREPEPRAPHRARRLHGHCRAAAQAPARRRLPASTCWSPWA